MTKRSFIKKINGKLYLIVYLGQGKYQYTEYLI